MLRNNGILLTTTNPEIGYTEREGSDDGTHNRYLQTVMDPITYGGIKCPVYALVPTTCKRVLTSLTLNTPTNAGSSTPTIGILFTPHNIETQGHVFIYWPQQGINVWTWWQALIPTELLGQSYARARTVSACLSLTSASIASGLATLQGTVDAVAYQDFWNLKTTTPSEILPMNQDNKSVVTNTPLSGGVMLLAQPFEEASLVNLEGPTISQNDWTLEQVVFPVTGGSSVTQQFADFIYGSYQVEIRLAATLTNPAAVSTTLQMNMNASTFNSATNTANTVVLSSQNITTLPLAQTGNFNGTYHTTIFVNPDATPVTSITLTFGAWNAANTWGATVRLTRMEDYGSNFIRNGTMAVIKNPAPSGVLSLSGVINYEAIPNNNLARDLKVTTDGGYLKPDDLLLTKILLGKSGDPYLKMVYPLEEWKTLSQTRYFVSASHREHISKYMASGLSTLGGIIRTVSPFLNLVPGLSWAAPAGEIIGQGMERLDHSLTSKSKRRGTFLASGVGVTMALGGEETTLLMDAPIDCSVFETNQTFLRDHVEEEPNFFEDGMAPGELTELIRNRMESERLDPQKLLRHIDRELGWLLDDRHMVCPQEIILRYNARWFVENQEPLVGPTGNGSPMGRLIGNWHSGGEALGIRKTPAGIFLDIVPRWLLAPAMANGGELIECADMIIEGDVIKLPVDSAQIPDAIFLETMIGEVIPIIEFSMQQGFLEFNSRTQYSKIALKEWERPLRCIIVYKGLSSRGYCNNSSYSCSGTTTTNGYNIKWEDKHVPEKFLLTDAEVAKLQYSVSDPEFTQKQMNLLRGGYVRTGDVTVAHFPAINKQDGVSVTIPIFCSTDGLNRRQTPYYTSVTVTHDNDEVQYFINSTTLYGRQKYEGQSFIKLELAIQIACAIRLAGTQDGFYFSYLSEVDFDGPSLGLATFVAAKGGFVGPLYSGSLRWDGSFGDILDVDAKWDLAHMSKRSMIYVSSTPVKGNKSLSTQNFLQGEWSPFLDDGNKYDEDGVIKGNGHMAYQVSNVSQMFLAALSSFWNTRGVNVEEEDKGISSAYMTTFKNIKTSAKKEPVSFETWMRKAISKSVSTTPEQVLSEMNEMNPEKAENLKGDLRWMDASERNEAITLALNYINGVGTKTKVTIGQVPTTWNRSKMKPYYESQRWVDLKAMEYQDLTNLRNLVNQAPKGSPLPRDIEQEIQQAVLKANAFFDRKVREGYRVKNVQAAPTKKVITRGKMTSRVKGQTPHEKLSFEGEGKGKEKDKPEGEESSDSQDW